MLISSFHHLSSGVAITTSQFVIVTGSSDDSTRASSYSRLPRCLSFVIIVAGARVAGREPGASVYTRKCLSLDVESDGGTIHRTSIAFMNLP